MDLLKDLPPELKPQSINDANSPSVLDKLKAQIGRKKLSVKTFGWILFAVVVLLLVVQYFNAARYDVLVNVIAADKVGVNPTGERLDFGDLPHDKSATRTINLESAGNTATYIMVWKFGEVSDLLKVDKNYFTLAPHSKQKLQFTIYVPNSAQLKVYTGKIMVFRIPKLW